MVNPMIYLSFRPVVQDWCNKGHGMYCVVCEMVHIKEPMLLIGKCRPCSSGSGFSLSLSEWSITVSPTSYNRKSNVPSVSLNKTFHPFLLFNISTDSSGKYVVVVIK